MFKHKIELITTADIMDFVRIATEESGTVRLIDGNGFCVNGKSLLGAMATASQRMISIQVSRNTALNEVT